MKDLVVPPQTALRPPSDVMRLSRLGSMFATRLSFLRVLTRRLRDHGNAPQRVVWEMDAEGYGRAVYAVELYGRTYSLVALSQPLAEADRSDRVIATAWDAAFVLYDGVPDEAELARIADAAPRQEAGRFSPRDLVLSRANKSVRLWSHVVERLRAGGQPDPEQLMRIGYLMRTTAVYGNGKFGIADRGLIASRPGFEMSFMAEMLTVWLIRGFTLDLAEHVGGASLDRDLKRGLGIGNATGLGMAPFLVSHPVLLNNWMLVRETALARVRAKPELTEAEQEALLENYAKAAAHLASWNVPDPRHQARIDASLAEWQALETAFDSAQTIEGLWQAGQDYGPETQELLLAVLLEPFGDLVDGLAECLNDPFGGTGQPFEDTAALRDALHAQFGWALAIDFTAADATRRFWYVSEEKLEPRIGDRFNEAGADLESPLDIARRIQALATDLPASPQPLSAFLNCHPEHLLAVERVQINAAHPYSEIQDNLISEDCLPIDMLRAKLAMFGATRFDPKSDLWTRITLAQGAPLFDELQTPQADSWFCPPVAQ